VTIVLHDIRTSLALELIDAEIARLTRIINRWPTGAFSDKCRVERDYQLDLRILYAGRAL
jgi:hypothetical protein